MSLFCPADSAAAQLDHGGHAHRAPQTEALHHAQARDILPREACERAAAILHQRLAEGGIPDHEGQQFGVGERLGAARKQFVYDIFH